MVHLLGRPNALFPILLNQFALGPMHLFPIFLFPNLCEVVLSPLIPRGLVAKINILCSFPCFAVSTMVSGEGMFEAGRTGVWVGLPPPGWFGYVGSEP